jgi:TRAP-type C4-dicarboxylate transport system permease small subunit
MSSALCKKTLLLDSIAVTFVLLFFFFLFKLEWLLSQLYSQGSQGSPLLSLGFLFGAFFGGFPLAFPIAFVYIFLVEKYWKDSRIFRVTED